MTDPIDNLLGSDYNLGVERVGLSALAPDSTNVLIVGIIIAKTRPRVFKVSSIADSRGERAVWNFTLRDSPMCYINVCCWGNQEEIIALNNKFQVGHVVEINRPQIEIRNSMDAKEQFRPRVTSPYYLILMDNVEGRVVQHMGNCDQFFQLLRLPTKPIAGAYTLADIHNHREKIEGIDLLGILREVGKVRTITTREGEVQQVRKVVLLDQTSSALTVTFWDPDLIMLAGAWQTLKTVLFITDVQCQWSNFERSMVATPTSRTVVTVDPVAIEADNLKTYLNEVFLLPDSSFLFADSCSLISDTSSIKNVMNIQQVMDKIIMNTSNSAYDEQQFTALLYTFITSLDLDGFYRTVTVKCSKCNELLSFLQNSCTNTECPAGRGQEQMNPITNFDLRVMISDQTGSLVNCRLNGHTAANILNCTTQEYLALTDDERAAMKWKFLLERCAVRILVRYTSFQFPQIFILSCDLASPFEIANRLPHS